MWLASGDSDGNTDFFWVVCVDFCGLESRSRVIVTGHFNEGVSLADSLGVSRPCCGVV